MANSPKIGQDFIVRNTKLWKMGGEDWEIYSQSHKILTEAWRQMNADPEFYEQTVKRQRSRSDSWPCGGLRQFFDEGSP